jgi:transmembrane sensor
MTIQLLEAYLNDDCPPDQRRQITDWLATVPGQAALATLLDERLDRLEAQPLTPAERAEAHRLFDRIQTLKQPASRPAPVRRLRLGQPATWLAVASVGVLLLLAGGWWQQQRAASDAVMLTVSTPYSQTRRLALPDGSVVTLNGHSSVRYPQPWPASGPRAVWVQGEAFFEVVHTKNNQPFTVHLPGNLNVEVLGTRFNVNTRTDHAEVTLDAGRIRLADAGGVARPVLMQPGEMVVADVEQHTFARRRVDPQVTASWRSDKLIFDNTSLADIARMLEQTYGVQIEISDPALRQQTVSGSIPNGSIDTILNGLSSLFDLTVTRRNAQITIQ